LDTKSRWWIVLDANGMKIKGSVWRGLLRGRSEVREGFAWHDVKQVVAFKRDCFIIDSIRILFELRSGLCYEVHEDMEGFKELMEKLPAHLPGALRMEEWFQAVAFPAFATCPNQIYPHI
jgi:hypothetical protein